MKCRIAVAAAIMLLICVLWVLFRGKRSGGEPGKGKGDGVTTVGNDARPGQEDPDDKPVISWGQEVGGYRIGMVFPKKVFSLTEPVPCRVLFQRLKKQTALPGAARTMVSLGDIQVVPDYLLSHNFNWAMKGPCKHPEYMYIKETRQVSGIRIADVKHLCDLSLEGRYLVSYAVGVEEVPVESGKEKVSYIVQSQPVQIDIRNLFEDPLIERPVTLADTELSLAADWTQCKNVDGVEVAIAFRRERFWAFEPVSCDIVLRNVGYAPHPLPYGRSIPPYFELELAEIYTRDVCAARRIVAEPIAQGRKMFEVNGKGKEQVGTRLFAHKEGYRLRICALNRLFDMTRDRPFELRVTALVPELATGRLIKVTSNCARTEVQWGQDFRTLEDEEIEELMGQPEKPK